MLAFQLVFAILGMQLFGGSLALCSDPAFTTREACLAGGRQLSEDLADLGTAQLAPPPVVGAAEATPLAVGAAGGGGERTWMNPLIGSFDDFGQTLLLLYIMSTRDDWETYTFAGMDAVGPGVAPVRNDFSGGALYFISWMFIGSFFALNLFVGVIVDNLYAASHAAQPHAPPRRPTPPCVGPAGSSTRPRLTSLPCARCLALR